MKHLKVLIFMAAGLIFGFSSCLDDENTDGSYYDFSAYMTVPGDFAMTGRVITDNDITLYVQNTSAVAYQDGSYPERIYAYVKVIGEEFDTANPKDRYAVQVVEGYVSPIITVDMNTRPDTLEHHSVHKMPNLWAGNGTVLCYVAYENDRHVILLGIFKQHRSTFAHLRHTAGRGVYRFAAHCLYGVYYQQLGHHILYVRKNCF